MAKKRGELKVYGVRAAEAVWIRRTKAIRKVYLTRKLSAHFSDLLKWCAKERVGFEVVGTEALNTISGSLHHEGVCLVAKLPKKVSLDQVLESSAPGAIYLDGVSNPQNVGAILRVAAHFGVPYVLGGPTLPGLSGALCRVAEGAAEFVRLLALPEPEKELARMKKAGFAFLATSSHRGDSLYKTTFPPRWCLVLGAEATGVQARLPGARWLQIPGTGEVESLNVSTACSALLGEVYRQSLTRRGASG